MSFLNNLKPANGSHSIKEVVISLFLPNPIIKPNRFGNLIENSFSEVFQKYESIKTLKLNFKHSSGVLETIPALDDVSGFKFTSFIKGKQSRILQARNEENRTFISYHGFDYTRWAPFLNDFQEVMSTLSNNQSNLFVVAFSLHYIDEFIWNSSESPVPVEKIFRKDSSYLSQEFFNNLTYQFQQTSKKEVGENTYTDRLEINTKVAADTSVISISHNVVQEIADVQELNHLVRDKSFLSLLQYAHEHNKDLLKSVFTKEVQTHIGLK